MERHRRRAVWFVTFLFLALGRTSTVTAQTEARRCSHCTGGWSHLWTFSEIAAFNLLMIGFHHLVYNDYRYGIGAHSGQGLGWDISGFNVNQFGHPYNGGLYHSSARAHGSSYWVGLSFDFFGSLTFELMDPDVISISDLVATTVGGASFGESTYRLSTAVLRSQALGGGFVTGLLAFLLNPMVGVHELLDGPALQVQKEPATIASWFNAGGRIKTTPTGSETTTSLEVVIDYGNYFTREKLGPFDVFEATGRLNLGDPSPLADFHIVGVLAGGPIGDQTDSRQHVIGIFQHLDYRDPEGTKFGGQSVGAGLRSRRHLGDNLNLRFSSDLNWMIVGAASSEVVLRGPPRDYDHGTGAGVKLGASFGDSSDDFATIAYNGYFLHTLDGLSTNHFLNFIDAEIRVPLFRTIGAAVAYHWYSRESNFSSPFLPDFHRSESEIRMYLSVASN